MLQSTSSLTHSAPISSVSTKTNNHPDENLKKIFQTIHSTITHALACADKANTKKLNATKVNLISQKERVHSYLEAYENFKKSFSFFLNLKKTAPADKKGSIIQSEATKADVTNLLRDLFILKEWNLHFEKTPKNPFGEFQLQPKDGSRIFIDVGPEDNRTPSLFHPREWSRHFREKGTTVPNPSTLLKVDGQNNSASLKSQADAYEKKEDHVVPPPSSQTCHVPYDLDSAHLTLQPAVLASSSYDFRLPLYIFPRDPAAFDQAIETHPSCQPIAEFCNYKVDLWYLNELIKFSTQMGLISDLKKEGYLDGRVFELYEDTTTFQGKSPALNQSAAHMSLRPQTYDLIAYKILQNLYTNQAASFTEKYFLSRRQIWKTDETLEDMGKLFLSLHKFIEKSSKIIDFNDYAPLTIEKFILISSIFARTYFEGASNATCHTNKHSNKLDKNLETPLKVCLKNWQIELLHLTKPKEIPQFGLLTKEKSFPRKTGKQTNEASLNWRGAFKRPPSQNTDVPEDRLRGLLDKTHVLTNDLITNLFTFTVNFSWGTPDYDSLVALSSLRTKNIEEYSDKFMCHFQRMLPLPASKDKSSSYFEDVKFQLEEFFQKYEQNAPFKDANELLETPEILRLEQEIIKLRSNQLEYALLIKKNASIDSDNMKDVMSKLMKNPWDSITAYDPTLPPALPSATEPSYRERQLFPTDSMETVYQSADYLQKNVEHIQSLVKKFKPLILTIPPLFSSPLETTPAKSITPITSPTASESSENEMEILYE